MTRPVDADQAACAAQAIEAFQSAAGRREPDTAEAIGGLITALCCYADHRGISFAEVLAARSDARPGPETQEGTPMRTPNGENAHWTEEKDSVTENRRWSAEEIRALGATTDLRTLASIVGCRIAKAYQMARRGEWESLGIKIFKIGTRYRIGVQSILNLLGLTSDGFGSAEIVRSAWMNQAAAEGADYRKSAHSPPPEEGITTRYVHRSRT